MKSILVHVHDDKCLEARIQTALDLARSFDAHVTFLQATPFDYGVPGDLYAQVADRVEPIVREAAKEVKDRVTADLANEDVSWDWRQQDGSAAERLLAMASIHDLVILGACDPYFGRDLYSTLAADIAVHSHSPTLVVPGALRNFDCTKPALVAWNGSPESSRAVRAAVPLLARAKSVFLFAVGESAGESPFDLPPTSAAQFLSRHGIDAQLVDVPRSDAGITAMLREAAQAREAGYVVMGAYGHSRLRESLLGGVTREMMSDTPVPLLMHH